MGKKKKLYIVIVVTAVGSLVMFFLWKELTNDLGWAIALTIGTVAAGIGSAFARTSHKEDSTMASKPTRISLKEIVFVVLFCGLFGAVGNVIEYLAGTTVAVILTSLGGLAVILFIVRQNRDDGNLIGKNDDEMDHGLRIVGRNLSIICAIGILAIAAFVLATYNLPLGQPMR